MAKELTLTVDDHYLFYNRGGRKCTKCNKSFKEGDSVVKRIKRKSRQFFHEECWNKGLY